MIRSITFRPISMSGEKKEKNRNENSPEKYYLLSTEWKTYSIFHVPPQPMINIDAQWFNFDDECSASHRQPLAQRYPPIKKLE
jgi:hypothetical protein